MKRISFRKFSFMFMLVILIFSAVSTGFADDSSESEGTFAPLSPEFLKWQEEHEQQEQEYSKFFLQII